MGFDPRYVLDMRTVGLKWAALWFFLMKKDGREEGAQPEWPSLCWDHRKNFQMPGVPCEARDEAGEGRKMYKGHLICAGESRWLDGNDRKASRLTHGSQWLLMPEEAVRWDNTPRKDEVPPLWENSSDEYEEEHNTWNRGLALQGSSPRIQQCLKEEEVYKTALTCHFALDVIYISMGWVVRKRKEKGSRECYGKREHRKTRETCQAPGWFSTDPSSTEQDDYRATSEECQMPVKCQSHRMMIDPSTSCSLE